VALAFDSAASDNGAGALACWLEGPLSVERALDFPVEAFG